MSNHLGPALTGNPVPKGDGLRVLVVDDNVDAAYLLATLLRLSGSYQVVIANDGLAAFSLALEFEPSVLLLDLGLPGMTGDELTRRLRPLPPFVDALFVAMTGRGDARDREITLAAGFDHHLVKPVEPRLILKLLESRIDFTRDFPDAELLPPTHHAPGTMPQAT